MYTKMENRYEKAEIKFHCEKSKFILFKLQSMADSRVEFEKKYIKNSFASFCSYSLDTQL